MLWLWLWIVDAPSWKQKKWNVSSSNARCGLKWSEVKECQVSWRFELRSDWRKQSRNNLNDLAKITSSIVGTSASASTCYVELIFNAPKTGRSLGTGVLRPERRQTAGRHREQIAKAKFNECRRTVWHNNEGAINWTAGQRLVFLSCCCWSSRISSRTPYTRRKVGQG